MTNPGVSLKSIHKSYGSLTVIDHIDLEIADDEFLVLLGPSGCGKSTLLNMIAGLEPITAGSVSIGGRDVTRLEPDERDIAMVFQSYALYPTMSVRKNIGFGLKMRGVPREEIATKVADVAKLLRIEHLLNRKPSALSGGQQQRVAIGRALIRDPRIFLFDEPLSNLDAKLRADMRIELKKLHERIGRTIIYVTHDQIEAMTMADRIVVMDGGRIQQCDSPERVYDRPANRFVASFVGAPTMNFIDGHVEPGSDGPLFITAGGVLPLPGLEPSAALGTGMPATLGVRPEHISATTTGDVHGVVAHPVMWEPTGPDKFVRFAVAGGEVTARLGAQAAVSRDEAMPIRLDGARVCLFHPETGARLV